MELSTILSIAQILLAAIFVLVSINLYLVFRLKEIDPFEKWDANKINANLFLLFWIAFLVLGFGSSIYYGDRMMFMQEAASQHGRDIDSMMWNTTIISVLVVVVTGTLLFFFAWRYRHREGTKALYYPHNNKLEVIWTLVPAVVMAILVIQGYFVWDETMMAETPADAIEIEMQGEQFRWVARYPGADLEFGEAHVSYIEGLNQYGMNMRDRDGHDDLVVDGTVGPLYLPVGVPVKVWIKSKDVLHSMTMAHFRVKMDAVPGMRTSFTFTPMVTTEDWRKKTGNEEFEFEMSCQQICGGSHWNMRRVVRIVELEEYAEWLASQRPFYAIWKAAQPQNTATEESVTPEIEGTASEDEEDALEISMNEN
ncbi:MAG: cytochrome c oxidase subunit II [Bacteroidota bacterium]